MDCAGAQELDEIMSSTVVKLVPHITNEEDLVNACKKSGQILKISPIPSNALF